MANRSLQHRDHELIQIVDRTLAEVTRKSGDWLACRIGCTQCCIGVFAINQLDAMRLRDGLAELEKHSHKRASEIRERACKSVAKLSKRFPGDPTTGRLDESPAGQERFAKFANDEPCPVLNPETGRCELYETRPMTCRAFGPPVMNEDGLAVCELCFRGASTEEIAACEMKPDPNDLESRLLEDLEKKTGREGHTIVAFCLGL